MARLFKTWRLWNGLLNPPEHSPIFQRMLRAPFPVPAFVPRLLQLLRPVGNVIAPFARMLVSIFAPVLLPVAANVIGGLFAYYIASFISRERARGKYDLLALSPAGAWGASWTICFTCVYRFNVLWQINFMRAMAVLGLILGALPTIALGGNALFALGAAGIAIQFDSIQSVVIGCLCGMLGQTSGSSTGLWSAALFAAVQLAVYIPAALIFTVFISHGILAPLIAVIVLFALHEAAIRILWTTLRHRLQ